MSSSRCARMRERPRRRCTSRAKTMVLPVPVGKTSKGPLHPARRGGEQGRDRFLLVRPGREPECGRWLAQQPPSAALPGWWAHGVPTPCPRASQIAAPKCASGDARLQRGVPDPPAAPSPRAGHARALRPSSWPSRPAGQPRVHARCTVCPPPRGLDPQRVSHRGGSPLTARRLGSGAPPTPGARRPRAGGHRR